MFLFFYLEKKSLLFIYLREKNLRVRRCAVVAVGTAHILLSSESTLEEHFLILNVS